MYDINLKVIKKGRKFFSIFLIAGIIFLVILLAILFSNKNKLDSLDSQTTSISVDVRTSRDDDGNTLYSPTYYYIVNNNPYTCPSNSSSSIYPGTTNKTVYYDSKNPANCMTEYSKSSNKILLIALILPILFIIVAVVNFNKINKRVKTVKELNEKGKLVKNLPYHMENTGMVVNNVPVQRPVVDYTLPSGTTITLYGDPRHDKKMADSDGFVDIVIDENNPQNYFIDFEINRLSGNLQSDYYNGNQANKNQNQTSAYQPDNMMNQAQQYTNMMSNNMQGINTNQNINQNFNNNMMYNTQQNTNMNQNFNNNMMYNMPQQNNNIYNQNQEVSNIQNNQIINNIQQNNMDPIKEFQNMINNQNNKQ